MTYVSTPGTSARPRPRTSKLVATIGAAAFVAATGAAIAIGIAVSTDEAPAVVPSAETFTQIREGLPTGSVNSADRAHLNRAAAAATGAAAAVRPSADTFTQIREGQAASDRAIASADRAHLNRAADSPGQPR